MPARLGRGTNSMVSVPRVAVVIDEAPLTREVAARILRGMGMIVLEAADLSEAHEILIARHDDVRVVLVDPSLRGLDASRLRELRARVPAPIVLVGASCPPDLLVVPQTSALATPYRLDDLRELVERLL